MRPPSHHSSPPAQAPSPTAVPSVSPDKRVFGGLKSLRLALAEGDQDKIDRRAHRLVHGYDDDPPEARGEMITERGDSAFMVAAWRSPFSADVIALADAGADTGRRNELGLSVFMSMARDTWRGTRSISDLAQFLTRFNPDPKTPDDDSGDVFFSSKSIPPHIDGFLRFPMESIGHPNVLRDIEAVARHVALCHRVTDLEQWWMTVQHSGSQLSPSALGRSELWGTVVTDRVQALLSGAGTDTSFDTSPRKPRRL